MSIIDNFKEWSTTKKIFSIFVVCCIGLVIVCAIVGSFSPDQNTSSVASDTPVVLGDKLLTLHNLTKYEIEHIEGNGTEQITIYNNDEDIWGSGISIIEPNSSFYDYRVNADGTLSKVLNMSSTLKTVKSDNITYNIVKELNKGYVDAYFIIFRTKDDVIYYIYEDCHDYGSNTYFRDERGDYKDIGRQLNNQ